MALQVLVPDPYGVGTIPAYVRILVANADYGDGHGRVEVGYYRDQASRDANRAPLKVAGFAVNPRATPAVEAVEAREAVPARPAVPPTPEVRDADGNVTTPFDPGSPAQPDRKVVFPTIWPSTTI
jgi:hypothetical protein